MKTSLHLMLGLILLSSLTIPNSYAAHVHAALAAPASTIVTPDSCYLANAMYSSSLITYVPVEVECPICKTVNVFMEWASYGSYVYQWPSKYQMVFWPYTDSVAWYSCKKCRLTAFMGDFKNIPQEKIPALRQLLTGVTLPPQKERSKKDSMEHPPYLELSTTARLVVAEKVYRSLGQTDDEFWNHFYRVLGYHADEEGKQTEADEARRKSLAITERLLDDKTHEGTRKELLYLSGAMKHFLRDDAGATQDFAAAKKLTYADKNLKPEEAKGFDGFLSKLIDEYIEMLGKSKGPRLKEKSGDTDKH